MSKCPNIDKRTQSDLLDEMYRSLEEKGIKISPESGDPLSVLVKLYANMLDGTVRRLNRAPEKHKSAFLNIVHTPPRSAEAASGIAVFEVVNGYDGAVDIPKGTRVAAVDEDGNPIYFRLKSGLTAVPANISDIYWLDGGSGRYGHSNSSSEFTPWEPQSTQEIACNAMFIFQNFFQYSKKALLYISARIDGEQLPLKELCYQSGSLGQGNLRWSVCPWPPVEGELPDFFEIDVTEGESSGFLCLNVRDEIDAAEQMCLRMDVLDPAYMGLEISQISCAFSYVNTIPDAVLAGGYQMQAGGFYPFGQTLGAFEECGIFCDAVLSRRGAEVTVRFDLRLDVMEEWPSQTPEIIDFKWIMRKPLPKPEPEVFNAFAKTVRWEYWNGSAYCIIKTENSNIDFTREQCALELKFICPGDLEPGSYLGRDGHYLRLTCGECGELYKLPRKVHTPRIENLRFSFAYQDSFAPDEIHAESFGLYTRLEAPGLSNPVRPFKPPEPDKLMLIGFDRLGWKCTIKMYIQRQNAALPEESTPAITAWLYSGQEKLDGLTVSDYTGGLSQSGYLHIDIPDDIVHFPLFGKERYWIVLHTQGECRPVIGGVFLNAQEVENRVRYEENFAYTQLSHGSVRLSHTNIIRAWVHVRSLVSGEMELWKEYSASDGQFRTGLYKIDPVSGLVTFPEDIAVYSMVDSVLDLIHIRYDSTDGKNGNLPADSKIHMEQEIPFIGSVRNPLPSIGGEDSESGEALALRKQNALYNGGRIVTKRDYELAAADTCHNIHSARCVFHQENREILLAILLKEDAGMDVFRLTSSRLRHRLEKMTAAYGNQYGTRIVPVDRVGCNCVLHIGDRKKWEKHYPGLEKKLRGFLNPVTGGASGKGWEIGILPTEEQIKAFILRQRPRTPLLGLRVNFKNDGDTPFQVPGRVKVRVKWEDSPYDSYASIGR